jgi:hypothetical protein
MQPVLLEVFQGVVGVNVSNDLAFGQPASGEQCGNETRNPTYAQTSALWLPEPAGCFWTGQLGQPASQNPNLSITLLQCKGLPQGGQQARRGHSG